MELKEILAELCALPGPSGFEQTVTSKAVEILKTCMDEAYIDRYGNAIGVRLCGKPKAKKILLDAHLDEIGFIVTGVQDGFLRFQKIGGVDPRMFPDQEVTILTNPPIFGLVACLPPHIQRAGEQNKTTPISELWVDVGMTPEGAKEAVPVGTPMVFKSNCSEFMDGCLCGKAMDDRAGFAALLLAADLLKNQKLDVDLYIMGSTREEVSGTGAAVGAFALHPDCCVAVDVTHGRTPDASQERTFPLGAGPAIGIGPNMTRWMTTRMIEKADAASIAWQAEVMAGNTGTNAWKIQIAREGIATAVLSIPVKYMHSPVEVLNYGDLDATARLLVQFIKHIGMEGVWQC
ncbi:MAG: M42 family peptidase [Evtepia sp.]